LLKGPLANNWQEKTGTSILKPQETEFPNVSWEEDLQLQLRIAA